MPEAIVKNHSNKGGARANAGRHADSPAIRTPRKSKGSVFLSEKIRKEMKRFKIEPPQKICELVAKITALEKSCYEEVDGVLKLVDKATYKACLLMEKDIWLELLGYQAPKFKAIEIEADSGDLPRNAPITVFNMNINPNEKDPAKAAQAVSDQIFEVESKKVIDDEQEEKEQEEEDVI